jgi:hypothetical protein
MPDEKSRYELLKVPEFKSAIPPHLLGKLTDQERYLVETLSKMEQQTVWLVDAAVKANGAVVDIDIRQSKVELWKERLTSKWALILGIVVITVPVVLEALIAHFWNIKVH